MCSEFVTPQKHVINHPVRSIWNYVSKSWKNEQFSLLCNAGGMSTPLSQCQTPLRPENDLKHGLSIQQLNRTCSGMFEPWACVVWWHLHYVMLGDHGSDTSLNHILGLPKKILNTELMPVYWFNFRIKYYIDLSLFTCSQQLFSDMYNMFRRKPHRITCVVLIE